MIPNFQTVESGLYRGGQPDDDGWNYLQSLGVKTVVKLNTAGESQDVSAEALGMNVVYLPITLDEQLVFRPRYQDVLKATEAMKQTPAFVHCEHGNDRTGLVVACYRVWDCGWTKESAGQEMKANGFHEILLGLSLFWEWAV